MSRMLKTLVYRTINIIFFTFLVNFFLDDLVESISFVILLEVLKTILYYTYEMIWNEIEKKKSERIST